MIKSILGLLVLIMSINCFADDCSISKALTNKTCSKNYFTAKNQKDLSDYLINGKYLNGKLLNLEIDFNYISSDIEIAVPCNIKIKKFRNILAINHGICIKGSSIELEGLNTLTASKKAPIDIYAQNSAIVRNSAIITDGSLNISTSNYLPFDGEIVVSKLSILKAQQITISSKSSLIINNNSSLRSQDIALNGGNCELDTSNNDVNDNERLPDRIWKKLNSSISYTGTCKKNSIPDNLSISAIADVQDPQKLNFKLLGSTAGYNVQWKFDHLFYSNSLLPIQSFNFAGRHLSEVIIEDSKGFFRKVGKFVNINSRKIYKGQTVIFQFINSENSTQLVQGLVDNKKINLTKYQANSDLYITEIVSDKNEVKSISVPTMNYNGNFSFQTPPKISNPDQYINQNIDQVISTLNAISSTNIKLIKNKASLIKIMEGLKSKIADLSAIDRAKVASFLQVNIFIYTEQNTSSIRSNIPVNLLNLFINTGTAQTTDDVALEETIAHSARSAVLSSTSFIGAGFVAIGLFATFKGSSSYEKIAGAVSVVVGIVLLTNKANSEQAYFDDIYDLKPERFNLKTPNSINDSEATLISLEGQFSPAGISTSASNIINQATNAKNNLNIQVSYLNTQISDVNNLFSTIGLDDLLDPLTLFSFPQKTFYSLLSPTFITSVQLISSDNGNAYVENYSIIGKVINIILKTDVTQNAKIRIKYVNTDLEVVKVVEKDIVIAVVKPNAVIEIASKNNLQVVFNASGNSDLASLEYHWNFGDGQEVITTSKSILYNYSAPGSYIVSLTVLDKNGNFSTVQSNISISSPIADASFAYNVLSIHAFWFYPIDTIKEGNIYYWDFGDGTTGNQTPAYHVYNTSGSYEVKLTVTDNQGNIKFSKQTVTVNVPNIMCNYSLSKQTFYIEGEPPFTLEPYVVRGREECECKYVFNKSKLSLKIVSEPFIFEGVVYKVNDYINSNYKFTIDSDNLFESVYNYTIISFDPSFPGDKTSTVFTRQTRWNPNGCGVNLK